MSQPAQEMSRFTMTKALILAGTDLKQRSAIHSAASFVMDGHSVHLSQEFVEEKPANRVTPAKIRVCWQCPEGSKSL